MTASFADLKVRATYFLFPTGLTPNDLSTYAMMIGLLLGVVMLASYIPARNAGRIEPLSALHQE